MSLLNPLWAIGPSNNLIISLPSSHSLIVWKIGFKFSKYSLIILGVWAVHTYTDVADVIVTEAATVSDEDGNIAGATLADRTIKLPNASKDSYNLGAFYENEQFSARVNYNYRSEYFLAQTEFGNRYREAQSNVDAQLSWNVTDYMTVKLEALNLTNEVWENYYERETDGTQVGGTQSSNGRRYYLGASFNF